MNTEPDWGLHAWKWFLVAELRERMSDVKTELSSYSEELPNEAQRIKASDALKRIEEWNLFSAPIVVCVCNLDISDTRLLTISLTFLLCIFSDTVWLSDIAFRNLAVLFASWNMSFNFISILANISEIQALN
jgi:hypothetical protein